MGWANVFPWNSSFSNFSMLLPRIYFPRLTMKLFSQTSSYNTDSNPTVTLFETTHEELQLCWSFSLRLWSYCCLYFCKDNWLWAKQKQWGKSQGRRVLILTKNTGKVKNQGKAEANRTKAKPRRQSELLQRARCTVCKFKQRYVEAPRKNEPCFSKS